MFIFFCYYFCRNWTLVKQLNLALLYCATNDGYRGEETGALHLLGSAAAWLSGTVTFAVHIAVRIHYKSERKNSKDISFASKTNLREFT